MAFKFIERPITGVINVLAALSADRRFDTDNEGFVIMFTWFVYPIIWMLSTPQTLVNILVLPFYILLYIIDKDLFIDEEATALANDGKNVPKEGLPTSFATAYSIHSILWGSYKYLNDPTDIYIDLTMMIFYLWASGAQLVISILNDSWLLHTSMIPRMIP